MRLRVVAVGKVRESHLRKAIDDYLDRTRHYLPIDEVELSDGTGITRALPERFSVVALDPRGKTLTSEAFAAWIGERMNRGDKGIAFLIGGADGLPEAVVKGATLRMSMSSLTLPHRLARLVLVEQLYRAMTILRGEPYSR